MANATETRTITYAQAICEATDLYLSREPKSFVFGLGVPDPKRIFGTTAGLPEKHGSDRVFDAPLAENALTGIAIGAATLGMRPLLVHQRLDFALLSLDQIFNNAAKWHYMFGGKLRCPITIRMLIGRGWGQGPQHSSSYQSLFAHVPGIKVVMPSSPSDAKGLLLAAMEDDAPVVYLEHRWLHNIVGPVSERYYVEPIGKAKVVKTGNDLSIIASSYMVLEAFRAAETLAKYGIDAEVIDLRTIRPYDGATIGASIEKTGRVMVCDTGHKLCGISAEFVARAAEHHFGKLRCAPRRVASPDFPAPTTPALARYYYPRSHDIAALAFEMMSRSNSSDARAAVDELYAVENKVPSDKPDLGFTGPF